MINVQLVPDVFDVMAGILQLDISELEQYAAKSEHPCSISSTCTVFAESEVISQLSNNVDLSDLVAGICSSVAKRTAALAKRTAITDKVCMRRWSGKKTVV